MFQQPRRAQEPSISVSIGHWTDEAAKTGCTVVLFDRAAPAVVDVRGGAPGTRETDLLGPDRLVRSVDAIVLTGGSAFGLAAVDGVMTFLRAQGRGVETRGGPVPIVPAGVIFDLAVGQSVAPTAESGRRACEAAVPLNETKRGLIGAGTGATTDKMFGGDGLRGGFGLNSVTTELGTVTALLVVNAAGRVVNVDTGRSPIDENGDPRRALLGAPVSPGENQATTLAIVLIDAPVDEVTLRRCAIAAHDGFARAIRPCHTIFDGDLVFAVALRKGTPTPVETFMVATATELAVEQAIIDAVTA